jgi:holin-like protein
MNLIYEVVSIVLIYGAGILLADIIPIPSSLLSMALFFFLLLAKVLKGERYTRLSKLILGHLSFFFIPPAVQILDSMDILQGNVMKLLTVLVVSNLLVMAVSGTVVQFFLKKEESHD